MDRRSLMKLAASNAVSACLLSGITDNAINAHAAAPPARPRGDFVEVADGVRPKWLEDGKKAFFVAETSPSLQDWVKALMLTTPLTVALETNRHVTATDFRKELPGISVPTLIIQGDNDASAPIDLTGRPTAALIPKAELRVYEGAPHGLFLTHKDRLNADLLGFIKA